MIWKYSVEGKGVVFSMPKIRKIRQGFVWQPFVHYCIKNCYPIRIPKQMMMLSGFTKVPKKWPEE